MPLLFVYLGIFNFEINYKDRLTQPLFQSAKMPQAPKALHDDFVCSCLAVFLLPYSPRCFSIKCFIKMNYYS